MATRGQRESGFKGEVIWFGSYIESIEKLQNGHFKFLVGKGQKEQWRVKAKQV